jgi:hypothetical protein
VIYIHKLLILAAILGGLFLLYKILINKKTGKGEEKPKTTQDLFGKDAVVSPDGIIETGGVFRVCLQVSQVNMRTNADMEKLKVWVAFRSFLNEIGLSYTLLQLSQFVDVREYARWYSERLEKSRLTPALKESGQNVVKFIEELDENKNSRDYSGYIVFHYDPDDPLFHAEAGVKTGNPKVDEVISRLTGKKHLPAEERKSLARMVLNEAVQITRSYAEQMGMQCKQLDRAGVYDLSYRIIQKDMSAFSGVEEASDAQCFTTFHESLTAKLVQLETFGEGRE